MNAAEQLEKGIENLQRRGWTVGDAGMWRDDVPACLLASMGAPYRSTEATATLAGIISRECDAHITTDELMLVAFHNDVCLKSGEDAILLMKKALAEV